MVSGAQITDSWPHEERHNQKRARVPLSRLGLGSEDCAVVPGHCCRLGWPKLDAALPLFLELAPDHHFQPCT